MEALRRWMHSMNTHRNEIGEMRREMQLGFARIDQRFAMIDARLERVDTHFARTESRLATGNEPSALLGRIDTVSERMERAMDRGLREQARLHFLPW